MGTFKVVFLIVMMYGAEPQVAPVPGLTYNEAILRCNIVGQYLMNQSKKWSTYQCIREDTIWEDDATTDKR